MGVIQQRQLLEVEETTIMHESVSGRIYNMYVRSQVRCSLPASKFSIEREYIGGLSKAKCLY